MLFTTKTCPNCKMAKVLLDAGNVEYEVIDAEEHADLSRQYNISQAPTLVIIDKDKISTISNITNIKQFIKG